MNTTQLTASRKKRRNAMALILVIITVALLSILIVAIFSITRTEYKATQNFVAARTARQLADMGVAMVQAQIQNAQNTERAANSRTIHATQPGMARVYNAQGNFLRAHKLYSSSQMIVTGSSEAVLYTQAHQAPADWAELPERYVDLNQPVVRAGLNAGQTAVYFPIIDPRAAYNFLGGQTPSSGQPTTQVEGFSYTKQTPQTTGGSQVTYNEVVLPTEVSDSAQLRLPMPVEWIYILQDGTTGALDASNKFISSSSVQPTAANPIVGRVAFWTDDESCKVNINTAAEPTFFAPPFFYHQRDSKWANFPGAGGEYQRYPGHPATVALSAVLAPGMNLDPFAIGANVNNIIQTKEQIYNLMPKIAQGGSMSGTRPFMTDAFSSANNEGTPATIVDAQAARNERLFASVDEMLFTDNGYDTTTGRQAARFVIPGGGGRILLDHDVLERSRFFLTAHSRSPEFTSYGLPRIAIWPVADEGMGANRRTTFDNIIALCATLGSGKTGAAIPHSYIFRRARAHDATHDVTGSSSRYGSSQGLRRNSQLLDYLYAQMTGLTFPQIASGTSTANFGQKYGNDNTAQLAVQFFDYIRSTNLYDGVLARDNDGIDGKGKSGTALYTLNDLKEGSYYTYTNHRVTRKATGSLKSGEVATIGSDYLSDEAEVFPGHGQVTPALWQKNGSVYRGFGRMFTLSEVGFQFICTADGRNDQYAVTFNGQQSGGGSAPKADPTRDSKDPVYLTGDFVDQNPVNDRMARWYSNFPPLLPQPGQPDPNPPAGLYGTIPVAGHPMHPSRHPGFQPENWNMTLENRKPLAPDEKRVQALLMLETFCPMLGWTKIHPEYAVVLDGNFVSGIKLNGTPLWDTTQDWVIKSNGNLYQNHDVYSLGGHAGPSAVAGNRSTRPISGSGQVLMPSDPGYVTGNTSGHNALGNYGLASDFITVKRNQPMQLTFGKRELVIKIYDTHNYQAGGVQPIQIINIAFDPSSLPVPALAYSQQRRLGSSNGPGVDSLTHVLANGQPGADQSELNYYSRIDAYGRIVYWRSLQGPHWWAFNNEGCIGRLQGVPNPAYSQGGPQPFWAQAPTPFPVGANDTPLRQTLRGRLDTTARRTDGPPGSARGFSLIPLERVTTSTPIFDQDVPGARWTGTDVIRTMVPAVGDYRLIAARYNVPTTMWMKHPVWAKTEGMGLAAPKTIHSFTTHWANSEEGVVLPTNGNVSDPVFGQFVSKNHQMVQGAPYDDRRHPDLPPDNGWAMAANSFGDFDNGIANSRDGPWINKPDEGNFFAANFTRWNTKKFYRSGYFFEPWHNSDDWRSGVYMTPNRIIASPVTFGSLPTGVHPGGSHPGALLGTGVSFSQGKPWQTLLFRPYAKSNATVGKSVASPGHPGDQNPRDHFLLDLFCMPVVEPYAISEPLSVAGRLNLNYQIMPFTNITRATGMHALMKGEFITAIPRNDDVNNAKEFFSSSSSQWSSSGDQFWDEQNQRKFWHRPINVSETLKQFEEKFNNTATGPNHDAQRFRGLFRTASQICEIHLIPDVSKGWSLGGEQQTPLTNISNGNTRQDVMDDFWQKHSPTGDNTRERPYSNLYARVTTRSNTFRVHMRAQVIRKSRSSDPATFDAVKDAVVGDYRGSTLIERYIDPNDPELLNNDYGAASNPLSLPPLDTFYRFRTLESKRFSP